MSRKTAHVFTVTLRNVNALRAGMNPLRWHVEEGINAYQHVTIRMLKPYKGILGASGCLACISPQISEREVPPRDDL